MKRWPTKPLEELVTDLQPGFACRPSERGTETPQIRPLNLTELGTMTLDGTKSVECSALQTSRYSLLPSDVLFNNTNSPELVGKVAVFRESGRFVFSNHITRIRVRRDRLLPEFLHRFLFKAWSDGFFQHHCTQWINQAAINVDALAKVTVPVPPLTEQGRIVKLLDEADELRKLRTQADCRTAALIPSLFHEMFGDPLRKTSRLPILPLGEVVDFGSGATPAKENSEFWKGRTPWVSPKDMKPDEITDAEDHVSAAAFEKSNLQLIPKDTVLIVVRGMILAHTVPIRLCRVPVAINQDMKALLPKQPIEQEFLRWSLQAQHPHLLSQVSTAGHGTKKLDTDRLRDVTIRVPPLVQQREFAARVSEIRAVQAEQTASRRRLDDLFASLLHRAFNGGL